MNTYVYLGVFMTQAKIHDILHYLSERRFLRYGCLMGESINSPLINWNIAFYVVSNVNRYEIVSKQTWCNLQTININ